MALTKATRVVSADVDMLIGGTLAESTDAIIVTPEQFGADGTNDQAAFNRATKAAGFGKIWLTPGKVYKISGPVTMYNCTGIYGNGAKIIYTATPTESTVLFNVGTKKFDLSGASVEVTAKGTTVTVPGISGSVAVGDLLSLGSDAFRLEYGNNYRFGQRCIVTAVNGDTVTVATAFYESFVANSITVHDGVHPLHVKDVTIDMQAVGATSVTCQALSLTGCNIEVSNVKLLGSKYCTTGVGLQGCNAKVDGSVIGGFLDASGTTARVGYGVYVDCDNTLVQDCTLYRNKHCVTAASRRYVMKGLVVRDCVIDTTNADVSVDACLDTHSNVVGTAIFEGNQLNCGGSAFTVRSGAARISGNAIKADRTGASNPALIGIAEWPDSTCIEFSNNHIDATSNVRLLFLDEVNSITNLTLRDNSGTIGSLLNQGVNTSLIKDFTIEGNRLSGMTNILVANKRGRTSPQTLFRKLDGMVVRNNTFEADNSVAGSPVFDLFTHADNAASDKLEVNDLVFEDNIVVSKDTPVRLRYLKLTGACSFEGNTFRHEVTTNTTSAPSRYSVDIHNCSMEEVGVVDNKMPGYVHFWIGQAQEGTTVQYPAEVLDTKFDLSDNTFSGLSCEATVNDDNYRFNFLDSSIHDNLAVSAFGTTIGITGAMSLMTVSPGIIDIAGNVLKPASGSAVGLGGALRQHKIAMHDNLMTAAISAGGNSYLNVNNHQVSA